MTECFNTIITFLKESRGTKQTVNLYHRFVAWETCCILEKYKQLCFHKSADQIDNYTVQFM
jgi:hypothetical protein